MLTSLKNAARASRRRGVQHVQARLMSAAPARTGIDAKVRKVLPEDYQVVLATLGMYVGIVAIFKMWPKKEKPAVAPVAAADFNSEDDIPSLFDDEFDEWSKVPGNMKRWEESLETWGE